MDSMREQMGTLSWDTGTIFKNPTKSVELKNITSVLRHSKRKKVCKLKDRATETIQNKAQRKKKFEIKWTVFAVAFRTTISSLI